jgi:hypothetical protein
MEPLMIHKSVERLTSKPFVMNEKTLLLAAIAQHFADLGYAVDIDEDASEFALKTFTHTITFVAGYTPVRFFRLVTVYFGDNVRVSSTRTTRIAITDFRKEGYYVPGICKFCGCSDQVFDGTGSWPAPDICPGCETIGSKPISNKRRAVI